MSEQQQLGLSDLALSQNSGSPAEKSVAQEERRDQYRRRIAQHLSDPTFTDQPGFPHADKGTLLRLSDPPFYTAFPNPFIGELLVEQSAQPENDYLCTPFAVDVSEGKHDRLYQAHPYHTKVPHLAIAPSILHYTSPGDVVLDGFCGSGMTGVAAQWCGQAPPEYRADLESAWTKAGLGAPEWGSRKAVLADLSPAATFIAAGYCLPVDSEEFGKRARVLLSSVREELGWMYETKHHDGRTGEILFTVWSEVFSCPECGAEFVFMEEAYDRKKQSIRKEFSCPACAAKVGKRDLDPVHVSSRDPATGEVWKRIKMLPALIQYSVGGEKYQKTPDSDDLRILGEIEALPLPPEVPTARLPIEEMYHGSRLAPKGFTRVHHLFTARARHYIAWLWRKASSEPETRLRNMLLFLVEQAVWTSSLMNRYQPKGYKQVNKYLPGVYYIPSQHTEVSPWYALEARAERLEKVFSGFRPVLGEVAISTGDCARLPLPDESVDYIFTDPPFGANIPYADLNILVESWHGVLTDPTPEAIVDTFKKKGQTEYQNLMRECFKEYYRTLKPGRWMTVVFSNSSNSIWRAIQEAIGTAGFVIADVRTLDKQLGSYRQVTSSAVKQDLIISAYKPGAELTESAALIGASEQSAWEFVSTHLSQLPIMVVGDNGAERVVERTPQMLHDRMVAFHVQRGIAVPLSGAEFFSGLAQRYPEREGMYFLTEQVAEYDRKRAKVAELRQFEIFVNDEASAIQWIRQELDLRPRSFQDLQPEFMKELQAWAKHERTVELKEILEQNFLRYEGHGPVPAQIHSYLSTNYKTLRGRDKDDPELEEKARGRWYVPDPNRQGDLEKLRERALLKEFEHYRGGKKKLKEFRTEAVRAGFKAAYDERDYETIVAIARRLPDAVLQEDEKLLMYYDVASMRLE